LHLNPLKAPPGIRAPLMGNEAIARGAVEAGVYLVTGYPGTPSSEVIMALQEYGGDLNIYVEWAVNERVAFELALGAAIGGARSMTTMKAPGMNVAADPVVSAAYCGVDGGLVILVADDPGPHTTQTEQDSRWYGKLAKIPVVSPSDPQEAKDFTVKTFDFSEEVKLPVILRTTTRVNHTVGDVVLGEVKPPKGFQGFRRDPLRFVRAGMVWNLERHRWVNRQLAYAEEASERFGFNSAEGSGKICIVTEGAAYNYVVEALEALGRLGDVRVVKLGLLHPFPRKFVLRALEGCEEVAVVEELDPFVEEELIKTLYAESVRIPVKGKLGGGLPLEGELNPVIVRRFLAEVLGMPAPLEHPSPSVTAPPRPPPLCPGCPHRFSFIALRRGLTMAGFSPGEVPVFGDIGCYALSVHPPLNAIWTEHSMGASISMAAGMKLAGFPGPVVAVIGDSTFYHAGIQPLLEAVHKRVDILVLILDNGIVAMTGHQSTPAWGRTETGREAKPVDLVDAVRALGVDYLTVVDPYNLEEASKLVAEAVRARGVKVVVMRHPCALVERRIRGVEKVYAVDPEKCTGCRACIAQTGCPAIYVAGGKAWIDSSDCTGCGLCAKFCPFNAIVAREVRAR